MDALLGHFSVFDILRCTSSALLYLWPFRMHFWYTSLSLHVKMHFSIFDIWTCTSDAFFYLWHFHIHFSIFDAFLCTSLSLTSMDIYLQIIWPHCRVTVSTILVVGANFLVHVILVIVQDELMVPQRRGTVSATFSPVILLLHEIISEKLYFVTPVQDSKHDKNRLCH